MRIIGMHVQTVELAGGVISILVTFENNATAVVDLNPDQAMILMKELADGFYRKFNLVPRV